jgi:hypothetical protein
VDQETFQRVWKRVARCFHEENGHLINRRLERERKLALAKRKERKESGRKGGRKTQAQLKLRLTSREEKQSLTPSPSPSPSLDGETETATRVRAKDAVLRSPSPPAPSAGSADSHPPSAPQGPDSGAVGKEEEKPWQPGLSHPLRPVDGHQPGDIWTDQDGSSRHYGLDGFEYLIHNDGTHTKLTKMDSK